MKKCECKKSGGVVNPYDALGKVHNEGLDYVVARLNPEEETKYERVVELVSQYLVAISKDEPHTDDCNSNTNGFMYGYVAVGKAMNLIATPSVDDITNEAGFNPTQKGFINAILNVSDERAIDFEGTLKILQNIEEQILNSGLTPEEMEVPLITASISKYSVKYFMDHINDLDGKWKFFIEDDIAKFKWPWKADGKGAIGGALGGVTSGPGGVVIGAIGGALGSSVAAALGLSDTAAS